MSGSTGQERVYEGQLIQVDLVEREAASGKRRRHEVVRHPPGVAVVALQEESDVVAYGYQVIMVSHYRTPLRKALIELVAGMMDDGESPLEAARRELREEVGLEAGRWDELGSFYSSPGFTDERITLFLARDVAHTGEANDEKEELSLCVLPLTLALEQIETGEITDLKTAFGLLRALSFIEEERRNG